jgi:hypothetical protein
MIPYALCTLGRIDQEVGPGCGDGLTRAQWLTGPAVHTAFNDLECHRTISCRYYWCPSMNADECKADSTMPLPWTIEH